MAAIDQTKNATKNICWARGDSDAKGFAGFLCVSNYERICPEQIHLKTGGGPIPIEIRVTMVKAVKP